MIPVTPHGRLQARMHPEDSLAPLPVEVGPTRLVILQPTSFCNIDCSYCYVPERQTKGLMPLEVVERLCERLIDEGLLGSRCSVVWHAGEPLTAGKRYMEQAFELVRQKLDAHTQLQLTIQTNATLVDAQWVEMFERYRVRVGVSLDGPAWLHDPHRKDRQQRGSFAATVRGLERIMAAKVDHYILSVVTRASLPAAREFYAFFKDLGVRDVGLIPEEADGIHLQSSLEGDQAVQGFANFLAELHAAYLEGGRQPEIREFRGVREALFYTPPITSVHNNKTTAYHLLTVDKSGGYTTYSPELAGMHGPGGMDYMFGNVLHDPILASVHTPKFQAFYRHFMRGVAQCQQACRWFSLCGGGLPLNKLAETGRLDVAETLSCRLHLQAFAKTTLDYYNRMLPQAAAMPTD